jgi:hypothetical protein
MCLVFTLSTVFQRMRETSSQPFSNTIETVSERMLDGQEQVCCILWDRSGSLIHVGRTLSMTKQTIRDLLAIYIIKICPGRVLKQYAQTVPNTWILASNPDIEIMHLCAVGVNKMPLEDRSSIPQGLDRQQGDVMSNNKKQLH